MGWLDILARGAEWLLDRHKDNKAARAAEDAATLQRELDELAKRTDAAERRLKAIWDRSGLKKPPGY